MDLTCELAPGYFAALYEAVLEANDAGNLGALEDRLSAVDMDATSLRELSKQYRDLHSKVVAKNPDAYQPGSEVPWFRVLNSHHAELASWLLGGEIVHRHKSYEIHSATLDNLPDELRGCPDVGALICWIVGRPVVAWNPTPPSFPSVSHPIEEVRAAYEGLLVHIMRLEAISSEVGPNGLEELPATSVVWRVAALVDGIVERKSDDDHLTGRLRRLEKQLAPVLTLGESRTLGEAFASLAADRNTLTHLWGNGDDTFVTVADRHRENGSIASRCMAITTAVYWDIALKVADSNPPRGAVGSVPEELESLLAS